MRKTKWVKGICLTMCEGEADYRIHKGLRAATEYAKRKAKESPDTHWIVWKPISGFIDKRQTIAKLPEIGG